MRTFLWTVFALSCVVRAEAQMAERPGGARMPTEDERVFSLLRSSNARDQAWGAWFAGRDHRSALVPLLQQIVAARAAAAGSIEDRAAFESALDALIQMQAAVPPDLLPAIYERNPPQALILASHAPSGATSFLFDVVDRGKEEPWFAAANLLMSSPPPGFAAVLLREIKIQTHLSVTDDENLGGGIGGGFGTGSSSCGGGLATASGLPPWPSYQLTTYAQPGWVILSWGPIPVYYQRRVLEGGPVPSARAPAEGRPYTDDRLKYVAALLGDETSQLPVRAIERHSVTWRGPLHFQQELEQIKRDIHQRLDVLAHRLRERGLLAPDESSPLPHDPLEIVLLDFRDDRSIPLSR